MLRDTWLVQRLEKPHKPIGQLKDNPFSFGGGYKNGGLSDDAMDLLRGIFSFDYMGAAEYEFGDVPKAINALVSNKPVARVISIPLNETHDVQASYRKGSHPKVKATGQNAVYLIAQNAEMDAVEKRVREIALWAHNDHGIKQDYKSFPRALNPQEERDNKTCGWLEIDNGFFFFTDREMWEKTCALFGIDAQAGASS